MYRLGTSELNIKTNIKLSRQSQNWSIALKMYRHTSVCVNECMYVHNCIAMYVHRYFGKYAGPLSTSHLTIEKMPAEATTAATWL